MDSSTTLEHDILTFIKGFNGRKNLKTLREAIAQQFGGKVVGRFVKINGTEYLIYKDYDHLETGLYKVRKMTWEHGDQWIYSYPY